MVNTAKCRRSSNMIDGGMTYYHSSLGSLKTPV